MKRVIFVAAALLLAGCETESGWVPGENAGAETARPVVAARAPAPVIARATVAPAPVVALAPAAAPVPVVPPPGPAPVAPPVADVAAAAIPNAADPHCEAVAHQRSTDARANGYSFEMAQTIYDGTYRDCIAWDSQHGAAQVR